MDEYLPIDFSKMFFGIFMEIVIYKNEYVCLNIGIMMDK